MLSPGDSFQFFSKGGELRLVLLVLEAELLADRERTCSRVLVLDATELAREFRAGVGETTSWTFDPRDPEWEQLRRLS